MRISDWSSDVCSSDLGLHDRGGGVGGRDGGDTGAARTAARLAQDAGPDGHACGRTICRDRADRAAPPPRPGLRPLCRVEPAPALRSEEHTSELQSLMRPPSAVFCFKKTKKKPDT